MSDSEYRPLTGDATVLRTKATHYASIADAITRSVTTLHKINEVDQMTSKATEKLKEKAEEVSKDIDKARDRYAVTAKALLAYAAALHTAQDQATTAIARIDDAEAAASHAHRTAATAAQKADDSQKDPTSPDAASDKTAATTAQHNAASADASLAAAQREWHSALDAKNAAAETAIKAIVEVVDGDKNRGLKDGFWDNVGSVVAALYEALKVVCEWAAILSIFLAWVPGLGEVLLALAALGAIISLIEATINLATGKGGWGEFFLALGGAVLTVFGGKLIEVAAKGVRGVMVARAAERIAATGSRADRVLARVQGIGMHSSKFMSSAEATAAKTALTDSVSSFSKFRGAAVDAFKNSMNPAREGDSMMDIFTHGMKDSFTPAGLGNSELAQAWKLGLRHPSLLDTKLVLSGLGVTALQGGKDAVTIVSQGSEPTPGHLPAGVGAVASYPGMPEGYGKVAGIPDLVGETGDVIHHFTHIR